MATVNNALALFKYSPNTLVFGGWNSTGIRGGSGSRFQRCIVSEIIGVNATQDNKKPRSRLDPLEISKEVPLVGSSMDWSLKDDIKDKSSDINQNDTTKKQNSKAKNSKAADIIHGNIPPTFLNLGVTVDYAIQTTTITFAGLRHLSFHSKGNKTANQHDDAARTVLAAIALVAILEQDKQGYSLRSRCDLAPENNPDFEIIHNDGKIESVQITLTQAHELLQTAIKNAQEKDLPWNKEPIKLLPQKKLVELIEESRKKNLEKINSNKP